MGCVPCKLLNPRPPDDSIRHLWHIRGLCIDGKNGIESSNVFFVNNEICENKGKRRDSKIIGVYHKISSNKRPPGIVYICNGKLCYKARNCIYNVNNEELEIDLANITSVFSAHQFAPESVSVMLISPSEDGRSQRVVDVTTCTSCSPSHFGILTSNAEAFANQLSDIVQKHRQKPKIMQFNSIDIDGVEVDCP